MTNKITYIFIVFILSLQPLNAGENISSDKEFLQLKELILAQPSRDSNISKQVEEIDMATRVSNNEKDNMIFVQEVTTTSNLFSKSGIKALGFSQVGRLKKVLLLLNKSLYMLETRQSIGDIKVIEIAEEYSKVRLKNTGKIVILWYALFSNEGTKMEILKR